jgi:cytochrome c-type biogenesis protein CcmH/NrfG
MWAVTFMTVSLLNVRIWAKFAMTDEPASVQRLIKNASNHVSKHPDDAVGYYTLGRLHSLAYAQVKRTTRTLA